MKLPLEIFVGLRYTRAKRRNHFISFISLISMLGIALGVTALIVVLSVMNIGAYRAPKKPDVPRRRPSVDVYMET